jgi:4-amino-4-deoxy-L-arabinose transferase-like glycosyltransferase
MFLGLGVFSLLVLAPGTGGKPCLTHYMEHAYSVPIPLEMRQQGEYLTPLLEGEPHLLKPPLLWWMILLSYKLFGVSLWAMRFPSVLCGVGSVLATARLGKTLGLEERKALAAGLLTLSSSGLYGICRLALIDAPLTLLMILAFDGLCRFVLRRRVSGLYQCAVSSGLSMMCKWPVAPAVIGPFLVLWLVWKKDWRPFWGMKRHWLGILAVTFAIAAPWNALMAHRYGIDYWRTVFFGELFSVRFMTSGNVPITDFLVQCLAALAPWTLLVLATVPRWVRSPSPHKKMSPPDLLILIWTTASLLPFLIQKTKTERYILFITPALIIGMAKHFDWASALHRLASRLTAVMILAFAATVFGLSLWFHAGLASGLWALLCGAAAAWGLGGKGDLSLGGLGVCGLFLATMGFLLPGLNASPYPPQSDFGGPSQKISVFSGSHGLAYLPLYLGKSLWPLRDLSGLRLALAESHVLVTDEESLLQVEAFVKASGGTRGNPVSHWWDFKQVRNNTALLKTAFHERSTRPLFTQREVLSNFESPDGFAPRGLRIPGPTPATRVGPGACLVYLAVDCPKGIENFKGFKEIGWVHVWSADHQKIHLSSGLYKRDLLRARPYIFVWPLLLDAPETLTTSTDPGLYNPPKIRIENLWIRPAPRNLIQNLYNNKHP